MQAAALPSRHFTAMQGSGSGSTALSQKPDLPVSFYAQLLGPVAFGVAGHDTGGMSASRLEDACQRPV